MDPRCHCLKRVDIDLVLARLHGIVRRDDLEDGDEVDALGCAFLAAPLGDWPLLVVVDEGLLGVLGEVLLARDELGGCTPPRHE